MKELFEILEYNVKLKPNKTMRTIFREVSVTDRVPKEEGYYFGYTDNLKNDDSFWFSTVGSNANKFSTGRFRHLQITHWLEKIILE